MASIQVWTWEVGPPSKGKGLIQVKDLQSISQLKGPSNFKAIASPTSWRLFNFVMKSFEPSNPEFDISGLIKWDPFWGGGGIQT